LLILTAEAEATIPKIAIAASSLFFIAVCMFCFVCLFKISTPKNKNFLY